MMFQLLKKCLKRKEICEPLQEIVIHPYFLEEVIIHDKYKTYNPLYGIYSDDK